MLILESDFYDWKGCEPLSGELVHINLNILSFWFACAWLPFLHLESWKTWWLFRYWKQLYPCLDSFVLPAQPPQCSPPFPCKSHFSSLGFVSIFRFNSSMKGSWTPLEKPFTNAFFRIFSLGDKFVFKENIVYQYILYLMLIYVFRYQPFTEWMTFKNNTKSITS